MIHRCCISIADYPLRGMCLFFFWFVASMLNSQVALSQSYEQKTISVYFPSDGDKITPESKTKIRQAFLEIHPRIIREVYIEGHTDSDASLSYNISLSNRRADNARIYLLSQGVRESIIKLGAFGESKPVSRKKAMNRRVLMTFVYETEEEPKERFEITTGNAKFIEVVTFNAQTKEKLPCDYVVENNNRNSFARTGGDATCLFDRSRFPNLHVIFSKSGFLNEAVVIDETKARNAGDTLRLKVYLKPVEVVQKLRYDHIYFYTDTDDFKPEAKRELEKLVQMLDGDQNLYVEIQGHMNFSETRQANILQRIYNHDLSHKRAKAVYRYLITRGIDKDRLTYKGLSNFRMIYPNPKNESEADQNKRVEVWTLQLVENSN